MPYETSARSLPPAYHPPGHACRRLESPRVRASFARLQGRLLPIFFAFLCSLPAMPAAAQFCADCLSIETDAEVLRPSSSFTISLTADAGGIEAERGDLYVAAVQPDNSVFFLRRLPGWEVKDLAGESMEIASLEGRELGEYQLHFVLAEPGSDPLDSNHWLAADSTGVVLLPEQWRPGAGQATPQRGLPALVTHGGGEAAGQLVSNSVEGLEQAAAAGQRFFELDFSWTADGELVLIHDWERSYQRFFSRYEGPPTRREFMSMDMNFGLSQLDFTGLLVWLARHPEVRIVTDIKERNVEGLRYIASRAGAARQQFVPQIYAPEEFDEARALGFENIIFSLYRSDLDDAALLAFLDSHPVTAVTMPLQRAIRQDTAELLSERKVFVYAHTVNHPELRRYLESRGVDGVYSDRLLPDAPAP